MMIPGLYVFYILLILLILQRLLEIKKSQRHEKILIEKYDAYEVDPSEFARMRIFHVLWFIFLGVEAYFEGSTLDIRVYIAALIILVIAQMLRFYSMKSLQGYWTAKIMYISGQKLIGDGVFKFTKHPSYIAVVLEFALFPLLYKCWYTLFIFSFLNGLFLIKRIKLEESTLLRSVSSGGSL